MRRIVIVAAVAAVSAGMPEPASASMPMCRTSTLAITLTHTGAVTGDEGGLLRFLNRGRTSCRLSGWPSARAVEPTGKAIKARHAVHGTMLFAWQFRSPLPVLTLKPGASAYAALDDGDNPVRNPTKPCPTARRLRISPPNDSHQETISAWLANDRTYLSLCTAYNGWPELEVSAVEPLSAFAH